MSWEKNIWEWRVIYRGLWDVIWIGGGRPTVRVSLGQSPPWPHTKKHFYNCQLMAVAGRGCRIRRIRTAKSCTTMCALHQWLVIKKNFASKKRLSVHEAAKQNMATHSASLCCNPEKNRNHERPIIKAETRECTLFGALNDLFQMTKVIKLWRKADWAIF